LWSLSFLLEGRMMVKFVNLILGLATAVGTVLPVAADTLYKNGFWFKDGTFQQHDVYVKEGRFSNLQAATASSQVIDVTGLYLLPPFAEGHNHQLQNSWLVSRFSDKYVADGILYGLMLGGDAFSAQQARQQLAADGTLDVLISGTTVTSSDGHPLQMILQPGPDGVVPTKKQVLDKWVIAVDSLADIDKKMPLIVKGKPQLVKLILVHSEDDTRRNNAKFDGVNGLRPELIKPLVRKLKQQQIRVIAHTESAADFATAVEAGVDSVAHLPGYHWWAGKTAADYRLSDEAIATAKAKQVAVMTTTGLTSLFKLPQTELAQVQALQKSNLQRLQAQGVTLLVGSDRFDSNVLSEIYYLDALQVLSRGDLLKMLVQHTPQFIFPTRQIGQITPGYEASFVAVKQNPLKQMTALNDVVLRVRQGKELVLPQPGE
jgi:imidazolonepropionase-like amidohydrolase